MKPLLLVGLLLGIQNASAQQFESNHPIDVRLRTCLDTEHGHTTRGMVECARVANDEWDSELNRTFDQLMIEMEAYPGLSDSVRVAQNAWIAYRDAEFELMDFFYSNHRPGTIFRAYAPIRRARLVSDRVNQLWQYLWALAPD